MTDDTVKKVAEAMRAKREELIARPLASIWPDLARAAISAMQGWRPIDDEARSGNAILAVENFQRASYDENGENEKLHPEEFAVVWWSKKRGLWVGFGLGLESFEPTHYMPLPLPPEGE